MRLGPQQGMCGAYCSLVHVKHKCKGVVHVEHGGKSVLLNPHKGRGDLCLELMDDPQIRGDEGGLHKGGRMDSTRAEDQRGLPVALGAPARIHLRMPCHGCSGNGKAPCGTSQGNSGKMAVTFKPMMQLKII